MNSTYKTKFNEEYNKYVKYISGTEKLWKNDESVFIQAYTLDKKELGRKFLKKNEVSYYEKFEDKRLNILGLTKKISLLFFPTEDKTHQFEMKNCFGFRYYEKNNKNKCNYFTLIKKEKKGYFILEKEENIKDADNDSFFSRDLDCFSIMKNIVYDKYKEKNNFEDKSPLGELFPEVIGYIYSMVYLGQFKNFIILEPFNPNRLVKESLTEEIPSNLKENIGYIEPILYDSHISVLLIVKDKKLDRMNYLFDMSMHHYTKNIYDHTLFPIDMISNLITYPVKPIQKNNSCGLWFYGILDFIHSSNKYIAPQDILNNIENEICNFYIDVVNFLSEKTYGLKDMIIFKEFNDNEFDVERIYDYNNGENISFLNICIKNYFFSLSLKYNWNENYNPNAVGMDLLFNYEKLFEKIITYKREIEMSIDYYKEYSEQKYYNNIIKEKMENQLNKVINLLKAVNYNFDKEFRNIAIENIDEYILMLQTNNCQNKKEMEKRFESLKTVKTKSIAELENDFLNVKNNFKSIKFLDETTIVYNINQNSEMLFNLLNK